MGYNDNTSAESAPQQDEQAGAKGSGKADDEIIKDCRDHLKRVIDFESDNRTQGLDDLAFLVGDQWPEEIKRARQLDGRPCLTNNDLPTYLRQVTGDQRLNKGGIKTHPVDDNADIETAETIQGLIRHIEYDSNADVAYDTAVNSAASNGWGYFRLVTEFCDETSFDQEIKFRRIRNPMTVYFDPASEQPDGSDARRVAISVKVQRDLYQKEYPDANMAGFDELRGIGDWSDWCDDQFIRIAEFYRIEEEEATVILLSNGESGFEDKLIALPSGVTIVKKRKGKRSKVMWYKLSAVEILERTEIKCKWIPVFPVYGDEVDIEGRIIRSGLIRYAKDPVRMRNFWLTTATEEVALRPKTPYIGAEGQFEGHEETWKLANIRSFPFMEYKPVDLNGTLAPPPQRQPMADIPAGTLAMAAQSFDNVQRTIGIFNAGLGQKSNETSGKAILARQREGDVGTYHYTDNLNISRKHAGRCIISMLPYYYDTRRAVRILGEDGGATQVTLNQPNLAKKKSKDGAIREVLNNVTVGKYDVTVTSGPSYTTARTEAAEYLTQVAQAAKDPATSQVVTYLAIKNADIPGAQEATKMLETLLPPPAQQVARGEDGEEEMIMTPKGPIPASQAGQAIAGMDQALMAAEQALEKAKAQDIANKARELEIKAAEAETKKYEAETHRMTADADLIRAGAEAKQADEKLVMVAQSAAREAVSLLGVVQAAPPIDPNPTPGEAPQGEPGGPMGEQPAEQVPA